jgi:hypothetical protein
MKNLKVMVMTLIVCSVMTIVTFGQEKYTSYDNVYSGSKYDVQISVKDSTKYTLYVDMMSLDKLSKSGGVMIDEKAHEKFTTTLLEAQVKYEEWVKIANDNNVTEFNKTMSLKTKVGGYFLYGSKWNFQFVVNLTFDFKIIDGKNLLIVRTGKMTSSSNQFMTHDGFVFVFSSTEEITEFLDVLSKDKITEFITKPKAVDLFKD